MNPNSLLGQLDHQGRHLQPIYLPEFSGDAKYCKAAFYWFDFGLSVIPLTPGTKQTAVRWDAWRENLSHQSISRYWRLHPSSEVGAIIGDSYVVFDADSHAAVSVLKRMEEQHGVEPLLVVQTRRGAHHYFRKDPAVRGRTGHMIVGNSEDRIDIKTGRSMIVLPPSTDKVLVKLGGKNA